MKISRNFALLWRTFGKYRLHLVGLVVLGFFGAALEGIGVGAAIPFLSFLIDPSALPQNPVTQGIQGLFGFLSIDFTFRFLLIFIVLLFTVRAAALAAFGYIRGRITADFLYHESKDTFGLTFAASWPFLLRQKLGGVHATLVRDVQCTGNLLTSLGQSIQSFTGFFIYLAVALNISPLMTLYTIAGGGVLLFIVRPLLASSRRAGERMAATEKQISQFITEHIIGMKSVKAAGAEARSLIGAGALLRTLRGLQIRMAFTRSLISSVFQPFVIIFIVIVFAVTYKLPGFNLISFAATLYLIQKIFTYLESGQTTLHTITEMAPYTENLSAFKAELAAHAERVVSKGKAFEFGHTIRFEDVSFAYPKGGQVLHSVSFDIKKGSTVGLIGPSGAGKTSVADLLLRLFEPVEGRIVVDGEPATHTPLSEWRSRFGYVSQEAFLLNGTIEENIRFYRPDLTREDIIRAAKQANIHDFVTSLPQGFDTVTGDRGVMLSGGQRQRVVLARALAGTPDILVLDEATSALDSESERLIQESIRNLHGHTTVFVIAHRLSTVENADTILVLERGRIAEKGSPQELLKNPDSYFARHSYRSGK